MEEVVGSGLVRLYLKSTLKVELLSISRNFLTLERAVPSGSVRPQMSKHQKTENKTHSLHNPLKLTEQSHFFLAAAKLLQLCPTLRSQKWQPSRLPCPWDSPGKNTGVGCHFLLHVYGWVLLFYTSEQPLSFNWSPFTLNIITDMVGFKYGILLFVFSIVPSLVYFFF